MRFALDLKDRYQVKDLNKYLAGTVYPDTRYTTKINRTLTHPEVSKLEDFAQADDFRKGWFAHLICDKVLNEVTQANFPEIFEYQFTYGNDGWIKFTALKVLQDIRDINEFDLEKCLSCFDHLETPNNENVDVLAEDRKIWKEMYSNHDGSIDHVINCLIRLGMTKEIGDKIGLQAHAYAKDDRAQDFLERVYSEMVAKV